MSTLDQATLQITARWISEYNSATDPNSKELARKNWQAHYDILDISDDGQLNRSVAGLEAPPPAPNGPGSSPPPSESGSSEASDGENSDTSGTEGTGSTNTDSTSSQRAPTPLLASLGNQFGIKTRILE